LNWDDEPPLNILPEDIPLEIVWEDARCIVINKAQGMVVHPGAGNRHGTLVNALLFKEQKVNNGEQLKINNSACNRPGVVHRLDKDTSGLIIAARDEDARAFLADQFKTRKVKKNYAAIVCGVPKNDKGCIETYIARDPKDRKKFTVSANGMRHDISEAPAVSCGKHAITYYKVIRQWQNYSLLLLRPKTGRTHQLRVHLRHIGCPILGDSVYGHIDRKFPDETLMLHSKRLAITLPGETDERVFTSAMPDRFLKVIEKLDDKGTAGFATEFPAHE